MLAAHHLLAEHGGRALLFSAALAVLVVLRGGVGAALRASARRALTERIARALVRSDSLRALPLPDEDPELAIFDGIHHGERALATTSPGLVGDLVASAVLAVLLVSTQPPVTLLMLVLSLACAGGLTLVARRVSAAAATRSNAAHAPVFTALVAAARARLEIAASGRAEAFLQDLRADARRWAREAERSEVNASAASRGPWLGGAAILAAFVLARGEGLTLSTGVLAQLAEVLAITPAFVGAAQGFVELSRAQALVAPLAKLLAAPSAPPGGGGSIPADVGARPLTVRAVTFAYAGQPPVLADLSFQCGPGGVVALVGPNGCGKSTCLRLMLGLGVPTTGAVRLGDTDVLALDLDAWRRCVAYLPQRPYFHDRATVGEALRTFARPAEDAAALAALGRVELLDALRAHAADPLSTRVDTLSAGQRQRLGLARVLLQDTPIVLLDEPDANLDAAGISLVGRLLEELSAQRTVVVAAHSEQLVAAADLVVDLGSARTGVRAVGAGLARELTSA